MSIPTSHNAAILPKAQAKLLIQSRATPPLDSDDVLIKITATAINPIDVSKPEFPHLHLPNFNFMAPLIRCSGCLALGNVAKFNL